jgi:hypothetical protein
MTAVAIPTAVAAVTILILIVLHLQEDTASNTANSNTEVPAAQVSKNDQVPVAQPETVVQYGNKYANGILPVGDNKYSTTAAQKGQILLCRAPNGAGGGAGSRGPWFTSNNTEYDITKKAKVSGNVQWDGQYTMAVNGSTRTITTNDVPDAHTTGVFPIQSSDVAYLYDRNPNTIKTQLFTYALPASPSPTGTPGCVSGEVGIMTTGVALFNGFDATGRDAGAWEVQDACAGHPQKDGEYHYHTLSSCITDVSTSTVIGYALDGYPITGPTIASGNIMTTDDLDECHGTTGSVLLDGITVTTYHYVMTQDFPYSVGCFRGIAISAPR